MLPALLGPDAEPFDLHFTDRDGTRQDGAQIIQVSNNPYELTTLAGLGTRARLDTGTLGIAAAKVRGATVVAAFVAADTAGRVRSSISCSTRSASRGSASRTITESSGTSAGRSAGSPAWARTAKRGGSSSASRSS